MFSKDQDLVGVSIGEEVLKVAYLKISPTEQKVLDITKQDIRDVPEQELSGILQSAFSEMGIKRPKAICAIPPSLVTTKNIEIPSLDPEEIKSIIDLQAGRHTPYSREEILVGYITIGTFQRNYTKVLLIIVNREIIKKQLSILEDAGARVEKILFTPEGMARYYAKLLNIKSEDAPVGIIDIATQGTTFGVEFNKNIATCRNITTGLGHLIKEGEVARTRLVDEILKSVEAYESEDINKLPETYVLTSDDAKIKELQPLLQEKLKANVKIVPYLDRIVASQNIMLKFVSEYNDDSFLDVLSVVSTVDEIEVDLTPDELKVQRAIEEKGREVLKSAIFSLIMLVLVCAIFFSKLYFKDIALDKLHGEYITKRKAVITLDRVAQKTRIIKDYVNSRFETLDVIDEMYHLIPDDIYLLSIQIDERGTINIQGISESMSRVFNFVSALEDSALFKSVKTKSTTAKKDRGKDVAAFEIAFRLESAKDEPVPVEGAEEVVEEEAPPPEE